MAADVIDLASFRAQRVRTADAIPEEVRERRRKKALRGWETRRRNRERFLAEGDKNAPHVLLSPEARALAIARRLMPKVLESWLYCGEIFLLSQR